MATTTEHFGLNVATGSDIVNPLVDTFPNFETIDSQMFANQSASIGTATEIKTGNVHALTRDNGNNNAFRFVATSVYNSGDSFTVDGVSVTGILPSGESLGDNAYVIGSNVFCILTSTQLTIFTVGGTATNSKALNGQPASYYLNSANENFDNTGTDLSSTKVENAIKEVDANTVNQKSGNSIHLVIPSTIGIAHTANYLFVNVPFPFYANNTSYNVTVNSALVDGIGTVTATPFSRQRSCVILELSASGIPYNNVRECTVDLTITFA